VYHPGVNNPRVRSALLTSFLLAATGSLAVAEEPSGIADNSFFIEEAYNQDVGVVQHISTLLRYQTPIHTWDFGFTQEWPLFSHAHQISYSIPYSQVQDLGGGFGDIALHYRYQLKDADTETIGGLAIAPRISAILPTGNGTRGALQVNIPVSKRVTKGLAVHGNAGATLVRAETELADGTEVHDNLRVYNLGASAIGLLSPTFNVMLEATAAFADEQDETGGIGHSHAYVVSPGVRGAINRGSLQIVPGLGVPVTFTSGRTDVGVLAYLSFEHPFKRK
jgi:hypothetical protein